MARLPRHLHHADSLEPGQIYHVTNRGVDRMDIFASDLDRVLFLSLLAEACSRFGAVCHAWSLMSNHFHLVVEDSRGMLSQILHRLEFCYARFVNDTWRRSGPLFERRFSAELIHTPDYFEQACAYVLLNPVRALVPMAPTADAYRWSSARLVTSDISCSEFAQELLASLGGFEAVLAALPKSVRKASRELRRLRLDALASGRWMSRERLLDRRSPELYREVLAAKAGASPGPEPDDTRDLIARSRERREARSARADGVEGLMGLRRFAGLELEAIRETIEEACGRVVPASLAAVGRLRDVVGYVLHRFSSSRIEELAGAMRIDEVTLQASMEVLRRERVTDTAWRRLLWGLEWGLRWRLGAGPHRA